MMHAKLKIAFATLAIATLPLLVFAQGGITPELPPEDVNVPSLINTIIGWLFGLLLALAALFIVIAAFYYLFSPAGAASTESARNYIIYAIVAIVVAFLARGIVSIVGQILDTGA